MRQEHERGLEGVFRVGAGAEDPPAYSKHEPAMTADQGSEGGFVGGGGEVLHELLIALVTDRQCVHLLQNAGQGNGDHGTLPPEKSYSG